jgi:hypothetical protein
MDGSGRDTFIVSANPAGKARNGLIELDTAGEWEAAEVRGSIQATKVNHERCIKRNRDSCRCRCC